MQHNTSLIGKDMSTQATSQRTDWEQMEREVAALIARLGQRPVKRGYFPNPGSVLIAYTQGDATFGAAVERLSSSQGKIVVTKRGKDYHARLEGREIWGRGNTSDAAIGDLIRSHRDIFHIVVEQI